MLCSVELGKNKPCGAMAVAGEVGETAEREIGPGDEIKMCGFKRGGDEEGGEGVRGALIRQRKRKFGLGCAMQVWKARPSSASSRARGNFV